MARIRKKEKAEVSSVSVRIPESDKQAVKDLAQKLDISMAFFVEESFRAYLRLPKGGVQLKETQALITLNIPRKLLIRMKKAANECDRSLAEWMRSAIKRGILFLPSTEIYDHFDV